MRRFWLNIVIAFLPAALVGLVLHDWIKVHLFQSTVVALAMIVGGVILLVVDRREHSISTASLYDVSPKQALGVGLAQILALIPGASRSASSIIGGLLSGLDRPTATGFSFYLAIPTLGLATVFDLIKSLDQITAGDVLNLALGTAVSFVVSLVVIGWLLRYIANHNFKPFAVYRIVAGLLVLVWALWLTNVRTLAASVSCTSSGRTVETSPRKTMSAIVSATVGWRLIRITRAPLRRARCGKSAAGSTSSDDPVAIRRSQNSALSWASRRQS